MRKVIVAATLMVLCMIYFIVVKNEMVEQTSTQFAPNFVLDEIQEWDKDYPATPQEVIEAHNLVMNYQYSEQLIQEDIPDTIQAMRKLYTQDLLQLNALDTQITTLTQELLKNHQIGLYVINSRVESTSYEDSEAQVTVKHTTTQGAFQRTYTLIEEHNKWKIKYWKTT